MIQLKLIAFNLDKAVEAGGVISLKDAEARPEELQRMGLPMALPIIRRFIKQGKLSQLVEYLEEIKAGEGSIPKIELVTIREGLKMGKIMFTNGLYELMMKADPSLPKPAFWDDAEIGIAAGRDLPVVGIRAGWVDQILGSYNRLTGSNLVVPTIDELKEAAHKVEIGRNKYKEVGQWTSNMQGDWRCFYFLRSGRSDDDHPDCYYSFLGLRVAERT
ncbi:hypothetical protein A2276_00635 [candidate division WOR-1 bacterium RIFOXYA12_FULL_43_27]|uniref:Uncharacterized protein n=1 Tax=candidate division WOR-1 bacterium RIFOXYC2_FULL_46_14 TaxID=1802587 RepID=A0A1F4U4K0_UNCSA|nr:MAG: hypothetical protein A2276_00635 [candidate division WOR-1 bacterium RIFOXYA12_FULL_43_27]OGC20802.1 MAG: hypothetical protein A2292_07240 [candidate division WOR-1 bacterium RIFOXYB2_FULL_46_45]OGC31461.1 MAG: hypothetical protein A2232_04210 [candidate division WOR-1 bacterium RIFOXYA2_FULL_46_56]OGC39866.1 MAG: hypothetical protein A2438_05045 [candidate division WOR-1 bacterium RIFOXYC2_FULL_46_14]